MAVILCVDDEQNILDCLERILKMDGYLVHCARNGAQALSLLAEHDVDVVLADHRMPEMTGVELLAQVRDKYPRITRIMFSGYSDFDSLADAVNKAEIFRFLSKPWTNEELREVMRLAVEHKKSKV